MFKTDLIGLALEDSFVVSDGMLARLNDQLIHPFLSSASLLVQMEWTCRKLIMPYVESNFDAIGSSMSLEHLNSAIVGMKVNINATIAQVNKNKIICDILATSKSNLLARASIEQTIVLKDKIKYKFNKLREKNND